VQLHSEAFEYVVVDEFHHAAAPSYRQLLDHVQPQILLGLTATPERSDQMDVLQWFGGRTSAEIRLPDAINRRLLCPFQYFGVSDSVDLDGLTWQRGGYIHHQAMGYTPLLFVRENKSLPSGLSAPYYFLGPCEHASHRGSRPISIVWRLLHTVPARLFRTMARQNTA
jgi:superfamily II DNA or RNA helicase